MRIAIFGSGGAGGHFGSRLARAGEEVVFLARGAHLEAIRKNGLILETIEGETKARSPATDDPASVGPVDVVVLGVKAWQVEDAARAMGPLLGPRTFVVPLQNGVEAAAQLSAIVGAERVIGGLCATFSWVVAPGRVRSIGQVHWIRFGELDRRPSERTERLRQTLEGAGVEASIPPDIHIALWEKFLFVVPFGGVGAVTGAPIGTTRTQPETRRMLESGMTEILAVGRARGIPMSDESVPKAMAFLDSLAPDGTASLQRDIAEGRPSELEAWTGAVVRLGREAGVPTPVHEEIYRTLLPLERRSRGRPSRGDGGSDPSTKSLPK